MFQIDPAFEHFENLTELDLGRNRLQALENLPKGLVSLSCAANELSGEDLPHLFIVGGETHVVTESLSRCTYGMPMKFLITGKKAKPLLAV